MAPTPPPAPAPVAPPLADLVVPLDPAGYDPGEHVGDESAPVTLRIDALGLEAAPVLPVGVDRSGELAVPGPGDVGWYRFGPAPGDAGSVVLAAHIAYDGEDGVFRHLEEIDPGDAVEVGMDDGTSVLYRVTALAQYPKQALPPEVWDRQGPPRLALVTCGGAFDPARRSYRSNVVAWAEPA